MPLNRSELSKPDLGLKEARQEQRQDDEQQNVDAEREDEIAGDQPGRNLCGASFLAFRASFAVSSASASSAEKRSALMPSTRACPSTPTPRRIGQFENLPLFADGLQGVFHDADGSVLTADGDGVALWAIAS